MVCIGKLQVGELCCPGEAGQPRGHVGPQQVPRDPLRQRHVHLWVLLEDLEVTQGQLGNLNKLPSSVNSSITVI